MGELLSFDGVTPKLGRDAFVAPGAYVIGRVTIGDQSSVWFNAILRGDVGTIVIGERTNIQDMSLLHMTGGVSNVTIGDDVTVGHGVTLHGCEVGHRCLIGMGSILLDGVRVGEDSVIGAGSLITPRMVIPPGSLVLGRPAKVVRQVNAQEKRLGIEGAAHYVENARAYRAELASRPLRSARSPRRPPR